MKESEPRELNERGSRDSEPSVRSTPTPMPDFHQIRMQPEPSPWTGYLRTLRRRWVFILTFACAGAILGFLSTAFTLPVYQARTTLDIPSSGGASQMTVNAHPDGDTPVTPNESDLQAQMQLLRSTLVLDRTMQRLTLEPHTDSLDRDDLYSRLKRLLRLSQGGDLAYADLLHNAAMGIKVNPVGMTRLIELSCDSWNADFAMKFCNTLTEEFKAIDLESRAPKTPTANDISQARLEEARQKLELAEKRLEAATTSENALPQQDSSVAEDRLRQLHAELERAQADRTEKESLLRAATTAVPDKFPVALDSPLYRGYRQTFITLSGRVAMLVPPLTEQDPKVIRLRALVREAQIAMARERAAEVNQLRHDFESARHHEDLLNTTYATLQASLSGGTSNTQRSSLLRGEVESDQQNYQALLQRSGLAKSSAPMPTSAIRVIDVAMLTRVPISPPRGTATFLGMGAGTLCGLFLAFFKERSLVVFRVPGEAERYLRIHELGVIPSGELGEKRANVSALANQSDLIDSEGMTGPTVTACWSRQFSIVAEAYRNTSHSVLLSNAGSRRPRVYVVTSANAGEGKSTVTTNLGVAFSRSKLRVVMIDADLRKPSLHKNLLMQNTFGLRQILREEIDARTAPLQRFCQTTVYPGLSIISAGTGDEEVVELLYSSAMAKLLERLLREFDVVLIDTPPVLLMADARILAGRADGVLLVVRAAVTGRDQALEACDLFEKDGVRLVGTVLNDFNAAREGKKDYYHSYSQYTDKIEAEKAEVPR